MIFGAFSALNGFSVMKAMMRISPGHLGQTRGLTSLTTAASCPPLFQEYVAKEEEEAE